MDSSFHIYYYDDLKHFHQQSPTASVNLQGFLDSPSPTSGSAKDSVWDLPKRH